MKESLSYSLPARLQKLYDAYDLSGESYLLQGPHLTEKWLQIKGSSGIVGQQVSRQVILAAWRVADDESNTTQALFLTMFWGYGSMRFGRRNTRLALDAIKNGKWRQLLDIRASAASNAMQAFTELADLRIKGLGTAFQTKILYGMTGTIPILDRHTRAWLNQHGFDEVGGRSSDFATFDFYNRACSSWAKSLIGSERNGIGDPCLIEYLMFWDAKRGRKQIVKESPKWLLSVEPWGK
jgi:hypothetical protein